MDISKNPKATPAAAARTGRTSDIHVNTGRCDTSTLRDIAHDLDQDSYESARIVWQAAAEIDAQRALGFSRTEQDYMAIVELYRAAAEMRNAIERENERLRKRIDLLEAPPSEHRGMDWAMARMGAGGP